MIKERSFGMYLFLSIITCGIYAIVFWYNYTEDINELCEGTGKRTTNYIAVILLSFITCGIYYYVWLYLLGERINEQGFKDNLRISETGSTIVLWTIFGSLLFGIGGLVAQYMLIKNFNTLANNYNNTGSSYF